MAGDAPKGLKQWSTKPWDEKHWHSRINGAKQRYPKQMTPELEHRLEMLQLEIPTAIDELAKRPMSWTHRDITLDNVLWRQDGSPVLLDWSSSAIGPPVTDLIPLLGVETPGEPEWAVSTFTAALVENGVTTGEKAIEEWLKLDTRLFVRGIVGFAGLPGEPEQLRLADWRDRILETASFSLAWIHE
jgi:aminoglycoside phosphotransferase (APT) family kinase protein